MYSTSKVYSYEHYSYHHFTIELLRNFGHIFF